MASKLSWPVSQDYNESIQTPAQCFLDPDLKRGEAVTNSMGMPEPCSGNFADVYPVQVGQRKWAVKCFTRQIPGLKERYAEISKYLAQVRLPFMVGFSFLDRGIRVRNEWYPILKMEWAEGVPLNTFVAGNLENPAVLQSVCEIWLKLAARLREAHLAHGDLQHGNVLLVQGKRTGTAGLRLVDYDGMCVPSLELLKATEVGHPAYQHPQRLREGTYGLNIDNFSHLVIYTALRALTVGGRKLWDRYDNGDNLLFVQEDFEAPTKSALFKELLGHGDGEVRKLTGALIDAARKPVQQTPRLEDVLPSGSRPKTKIPVQAAPQATATSPFALPAASSRFPKRQRGKRGVAAVLIACLMMAGIAVAAYALLGGRLDTSVASSGSRSSKGSPSSNDHSDQEALLARRLIGTYELTYSNGAERNSSTVKFTVGRKMMENGIEKAIWRITGDRIVVTYNDSQWGKAELRFTNDDTLTGQNTHRNGAVWSWALKKELAGEQLARRLVGRWRLKYSNGSENNSTTINFTDDQRMLENGVEKAKWKVVGNRIVIAYNDPQWGIAELGLKQ